MLRGVERTGWQRALYNDGCSVGRKLQTKNSRGIYETLAPDKQKRIILANDNDDRRRLFETCSLKAKRVCNPIIDWSDDDVWEYIRTEALPVNPLYECGSVRVGCIGCPMSGKGRYAEFARYPKYKEAYIRAFDKMLEERERRGKMQGTWRIGTTGRDVFHWWMEDGVLPGQMELEDLDSEDDD